MREPSEHQDSAVFSADSIDSYDEARAVDDFVSEGCPNWDAADATRSNDAAYDPRIRLAHN